MAIRSIAQLKAWFKRGQYPTQDQFHDWLDSFFHKEDKISPSSVEGLTDQLNGKYPDADGKLLEQKTAELEVQLNTHEQYSEEKFGTIYDRLDELDETKIDKAMISQPGGVAALDETGRVPSGQLPSFVDDVLEGTLINETTFNNPTNGKPYTPESGKIYLDTTTNKEYRWSGSKYAIISESLALGETSSTAYRGDRGKAAYEHSQVKDGSNPHGTTYSSLPDAPTSLPANGGNAESAIKDGSGNVITENYFNVKRGPVTDLNNAVAFGLWSFNQGSLNVPEEITTSGIVFTYYSTVQPVNLIQMCTGYKNGVPTSWYVRNRTSYTAWSPWRKIWDSGNLTKLSQLQDDVVAGNYFKLSANRITNLNDTPINSFFVSSEGPSNSPVSYASYVNGFCFAADNNQAFKRQLVYADDWYSRSQGNGEWNQWRKLWHSGNFNPTDSWKTVIESTNAKYAFIFRGTVTYDIANLPVNSGSYRVDNNPSFTGSLFVFQSEASNSGLGFYRPGGLNSRPQLLIGLDNSTSKWTNLGEIAIKQDLNDKLGVNAAAAAIKDISDNSSKKVWTGTEDEYNAITTKDSNTIYFIV